MGSRACGSAKAVACAAAVSFSSSAAAIDAPRLIGVPTDRVFFFGGFDVSRYSQSGWTGLVAAPFGSLQADGLRVRLMGGGGRYRYRTSAVPGGTNEGDSVASEVMLGWRRAFPDGAIVFYLGAHAENHRLHMPDPGNPVVGTEVGAKAAFETYWRPAPDWIATASASASTVYRKYHARAALAHDIDPAWTLGAEAAVLGDARYVEPRAGLLATATLFGNQFTFAGGYLYNSERGDGAYLTFSMYAPF